MTEEELLKQPSDRYMDEGQHAFFRNLLNGQREEAISRISQSSADLTQLDNPTDQLDVAAVEEERQLLVRQIERSRQLVAKIDTALGMIDTDEYGWCVDSGEPIGLPRLLARPTTNLSFEAKSRQEEKEKHMVRRSAA